jgi:hypothetical protein
MGLSPGGSTHLHTKNTQNNTNNNRTTQITNNVEECGPCPVFASFYSGICLTTEEKARKKQSVRETSVRLIKSSEYSIHITKTPTLLNRRTHITKPTHTHTHDTKQYKTKPVQIKTNSTRSTQMKYNNTHNITTIQRTKSTTITHKPT